MNLLFILVTKRFKNNKIFWTKIDETVKSRKSDGTVKSFRCKACKSEGIRRTYLYAAMTEDATQRRRWRASVLYPPPQGGTFYCAVKIYTISSPKSIYSFSPISLP